MQFTIQRALSPSALTIQFFVAITSASGWATESQIILTTPKGQATGIVVLDDGDSLWVGPSAARLLGIDTPNKSTGCGSKSVEALRCGEVAKDELQDLLMSGATCTSDQADSRNRWLMTCTTRDGKDIGAEMIRNGWACAATKYTSWKQSPVYIELEREAKSLGRGLWSAAFEYKPSDMCEAKR